MSAARMRETECKRPTGHSCTLCYAASMSASASVRVRPPDRTPRESNDDDDDDEAPLLRAAEGE